MQVNSIVMLLGKNAESTLMNTTLNGVVSTTEVDLQYRIIQEIVHIFKMGRAVPLAEPVR